MSQSPAAAAPFSAANKYRNARFQWFRAIATRVLEEAGRCRILDIGGLEDYWRMFGPDLVSDPRVTITLVNVAYGDIAAPRPSENFERRIGDARSLPDVGDGAFDVVHSNSVIEHVGRWQDQVAMATEVRRIAPRHFVQTPYYGFPLEPHNRTPFFHWLPEQMRYRLVMKRKLGFWSKADTVHDAMLSVQSAALLDKRQMAALFPESTILSEKLFGLTKSIVAVRA